MDTTSFFPVPLTRRKAMGDTTIAQKQYSPFRPTYMDKKAFQDPYEKARGPGYSDSPFIITKRPITLYKVERAKGFNPPLPVYADNFYEVDHGIGYETKSKGNFAPLKSASQRFPETAPSVPGPGSYHAEEFHGAFPVLFHVITPREAKREHHVKLENLRHMMGIIPPPAQENSPIKDHALPNRPLKNLVRSKVTTSNAHSDDSTIIDLACQTSPLVAKLTPRNAYNGAYHKQEAFKRIHQPTAHTNRSPTHKRHPSRRLRVQTRPFKSNHIGHHATESSSASTHRGNNM
ncbi:hypothetical protein THRCLA_06401 [Thraustotheca clavata]|uniref:Uncharacterized protein n=1 Tax=Thraustotheca clavata TaxID=74557 RepID=A0A1V9ZP65_9STRA|nr:hypothetical protein THRCLA_06401 [Thraustotheca clavata]